MLTVKYNTDTSIKKVFFDYDKEINESILKGIRFEPYGLLGKYRPESLQYTPIAPPPFSVKVANAKNDARLFSITLVDKNNNVILDKYPLAALIIPDDELARNYSFIRRFSTLIDLSKCYISLIDPTFILPPATIIDFNFTFYYK